MSPALNPLWFRGLVNETTKNGSFGQQAMVANLKPKVKPANGINPLKKG